MPFQPSPAAWPTDDRPEDPRFSQLFVPEPKGAHLLLAGSPFDGSVLGRKGCRDGPTAIREAMRFLGNHDPDSGANLSGLRLHDFGDIAGLDPDDTLATHDRVRVAAKEVFASRPGTPAVLLGGDHGLTFPHVQGFADALADDAGVDAGVGGSGSGSIGIVVIDAHYDLRPWSGQPSSGTPFRRLLEELHGLSLRGSNLVEVGIRPYANAAGLAAYAADQGVHIVTAGRAAAMEPEALVEHAIEVAGDGVDHLWVSVDIDGLDQSIAPGCSSPGAGGLSFETASALVAGVGREPRCRAMDLLEVAPGLDPTGNTARAAAQLVAAFAGAVSLH